MESVFLLVCSSLSGLSLINQGKFSLVGHTSCKVAKKLIPLYNKLYFVADFGDIGFSGVVLLVSSLLTIPNDSFLWSV